MRYLISLLLAGSVFAADVPPEPPVGIPKRFAGTARSSVATVQVSEVWVQERLYIQTRDSGLYLGWLTNSTKTVILATTNIQASAVEWTVFGDSCKVLEGDRWAVRVSDTNAPFKFFRLMSVPTNSVVLGWSYVPGILPGLTGFKVHEVSPTGVFTNTLDKTANTVWHMAQVAGTNTTYYAVTAYAGSQQVGESNEATYQEGSPGQPPLPCP